jgi:hypothetical protein
MSEYVNKLEDHKGDMDEHDLEKLQVWQMARELVTYVYREIVPKLPSAEKYGCRGSWEILFQGKYSILLQCARIPR